MKLSIDEMKRHLGINNAQLERGRELLEDEQLLSRIAAGEEDMREETIRDGNSNALLRNIYSSRNKVRKNNCSLLSNNRNEI
jgi:hypothetical protein